MMKNENIENIYDFTNNNVTNYIIIFFNII